MVKKINTKLTKLFKYYSLINHNLILQNKPINRNKESNSVSKNSIEIHLTNLKNEISKIKNCDLKKNASKIVFSDGSYNSKIMIIGEGPGANEDKEGKPFVGRAGQLLDKMLASISLDRDNVYITNVVNYRPPENRKPTEEEIIKYLPFLIKHIEIINPKILILLGSTALNSLMGKEIVISKARGKWVQKNFGKSKPFVIASFHPAFLMRQPDQKKLAWVDLKMVREKIKEIGIKLEK